jgi:hypothetical protein
MGAGQENQSTSVSPMIEVANGLPASVDLAIQISHDPRCQVIL